MALHSPPLEIPFINLETGRVTEPWAQWLIINYRDKANRVEDGTEDNVVTLDANGNPKDGSASLPTGSIVGTSAAQTLTNKTLTSPVITSPTATGGTFTTPTITVPVIADLSSMTHDHKSAAKGGDYPFADMILAATQADAAASTSHSITDPGDAPADADALRDDLVANAIPDIESALNALGTEFNTKFNALIDKLQTAKLMT